MGRNTGRCRIGPYIKTSTVQKAEGSRGLLNCSNHRGEKDSVQRGLIHESGYVGFRNYDYMDIGHGFRMAERQDQIVLKYTFHIELSRKYIFTVPVSPCQLRTPFGHFLGYHSVFWFID